MPGSVATRLALPAAAALLAVAQGASVGSLSGAELRANPMRKVVTMLQDMQRTVEGEGAREAELVDNFMCYCSGGEGSFDSTIAGGRALIETLTGSVERGAAEVSQLQQDLASHRVDLAEAEKTTQSTALREKGGSDTTIGIVKQIKETMEADFAQTDKNETEARSSSEILVTSKRSKIQAAGKAIEKRSARLGAVAVEVVQGKAGLEKTTISVAEDTYFKANLGNSCATKQKEWNARRKFRSEEIAAISETIQMLNGDVSFDLFKKTLPAPVALIQTSAAPRSQVRRVRSIVGKAMMSDKVHSVNRHLIRAAVTGGTGGFEKVSQMLKDMEEVLEGEQAQDNKMDAWCLAELDTTKEGANATEADVGDLAAAMEEQRDAIAALKKGLEELDESVVQATEQRKNEHAEYVDEAASNQAAVVLLGIAKNRLNKFYSPMHYHESEPFVEESFVQIAARRADPGPPPETFGEYKKNVLSAGIINKIEEISMDLEDSMAEAKRGEEETQRDYEETMHDAATKRSEDSKLVVSKEGEEAEETSRLEELRESKRTRKGKLVVWVDKVGNLQNTCDFLVEHYTKIRDARTKEGEGLKTAKAVLAGADFGFVQLS